MKTIKKVNGFNELVESSFAGGVNTLCWERKLAGDFWAIVQAVNAHEPITVLDEARLNGLRLGARGQEAVEVLLEDMRLLRDLGRDPVLNLISGYPRDEDAAVVATDVFSFHVDSAPVEADTWLCTYYGSPSEGLRNEDALRKVDDPVTRAALLKEFGGEEGEDFRAWLTENCYDLHFAERSALSLSNGHYSPALSLPAVSLPAMSPSNVSNPSNGSPIYSFGLHNLWRIAVAWPGSPVPPCIHRAPATVPGEPRLLLIC